DEDYNRLPPTRDDFLQFQPKKVSGSNCISSADDAGKRTPESTPGAPEMGEGAQVAENDERDAPHASAAAEALYDDNAQKQRDEREAAISQWVGHQNNVLGNSRNDDDDDDDDKDENRDKAVEKVINDGLENVKRMERETEQLKLVDRKQKEDLDAVKKQVEKMKAQLE
ncbi:MAG: hypothetical protein VX367_11690, partial [SAR324 cluster bacterium]|nr:hypothetical protein [SAR324 cluster bacterium]